MHLVVHDTKEKLQVFLQLPDLLWTRPTAPGGCYLIYKATLLGKIRPQSASDVHTWVCRKLQTVQALHRKSSQKIGFSDQYLRQVSQNYLATEWYF